MSYVNTQPGYYNQFQIQTPFEEGTEGWSSAPWPGWGQNANLIGPKRIAIGSGPDGMGAYYATPKDQGVGELTAPTKGSWVILAGVTVLGIATAIAAVQTIGRKARKR